MGKVEKAFLAVASLLLSLYWPADLLPLGAASASILTFAVGAWVIFRASEVAVSGIDGLSSALGVPGYVAGVGAALVSSLPELTITLVAVSSGFPTLVEAAVLSVIASVGFGLIMLAALVLLHAVKFGGPMRLPREVLTLELDAFAFTASSYSVLATLALILFVESGGSGASLPRSAGAILVAVYLSYLIHMLSSREAGGGQTGRSGAGPTSVAIEAVAGIAAVVLAGGAVVHATEALLNQAHLGRVQAALALALVGTVPEHAVAFTAASAGRGDIGLGNLLGGFTQLSLLVVGLIAATADVPADPYVIVQLAVASASMAMLKLFSRDDGAIDAGEAGLMAALQLLAFDLLLSL